MIFEIKGEHIEVKVLNRNELSSDLIQQWGNLEGRSIEGNAYLSPHFILPSIKYLTPNADVIFVFIRHLAGNTSILTGVGVFEYVSGTKQLPLPHLRAYRSTHSYLTGLLVDEEFVDSTLIAFFTFFKKFEHFCCAVEFMKRTGDTKFAKKIENTISQLAIPWYQYNSLKRAILIPNKLCNDYINGILSGKLKKNLRYGTNVLSKKGEILCKVVKAHEIEISCIDTFLNLENSGWKSSAGTSLLSNANDEAFFREMITGFAKNGRAFFTELTVNGRTIASTSNLLSAKSGYAFKIGWDTEFTAASPAIFNEVEFIKNAARIFPHLEYIDSGAQEGSFIEKLWTDHYSLVSGLFVTKDLTRPVIFGINAVRRAKNGLINMLK